MAVSLAFIVPAGEPKVAPEKDGPEFKFKVAPALFLNKSFNDMLLSVIFPVFSTVISYLTISPFPTSPSPLSVIVAVLVTSIPGVDEISTIVASFVVLPSVSSPSSEVSVTSLLFPGEEAVTSTLFEIEPEL